MARHCKEREIQAFLGPGATFEGSLSFGGCVRIDGRFTGDVPAGGHLIIGPSAHVQADIAVDSISISGTLHGTVTARTHVQIHRGATVRADLSTPRLLVEEGSVFDGTCRMDPRTQSLTLLQSSPRSLLPDTPR
jgi:cytoskeletal protein CcmA (bactofilin family)